MESKMNPRKLPLLIFVLLLFWGCVPKPKAELLLQPSDKGPEGYLKAGAEGVYQNKSLKIAASIIRGADGAPALIGELLDKKYVIIRLDIENKSAAKVIYNPTHTVLTNDADRKSVV